MSSQTAWRLVAAASHPSVFIRSSVARSGYEVFITDLCRVWGEKLSRRDIIKRALNEGCSIDPTEGDDQYDILLQKLSAALSQDASTTLALCKGAMDSNISLHLSAPLPSPLPPLTWVCDMSRLAEHAVTDLLITPLLHKVSHLNAQMQRLVDDMRTKDSVIFKIIDRLETSGQDLSLVFPNVSNLRVSKKKSQKEQYAPHVKGLAEFDVETWRKQAIESESNEEPSVETFSTVLADLQTKGSATTQNTGAGDQWWQNLSSQPEATQRIPDSMPMKDEHHLKDIALAKDGDVATEVGPETNGFERQNTPPELKRKRLSSNAREPARTKTSPRGRTDSEEANVGDDDETASEDEGNFDDAHARQTTIPAHSKRPHGGHKQSSPSPDTIQSDEAPKQRNVESGASCDETAANESKAISLQHISASENSGSENTPTSASKSTARSRGKLGGMGGKPKPPPPSPPTKEVSHQEVDEPTSPVRPKSKLGGIGGRAKKVATAGSETHKGDAPASNPELGHDGTPKSAENAAKGERQRPTAALVIEEQSNASKQAHDGRTMERSSQPSPPETAEALADRKRNELKREIEAKAKAPAKKKRKF